MAKELVVNIGGMNVSVKGQRKLKMCIGIPVADSIGPTFFRTMLLRMEEWSQTFDLLPVIETSIPIDEARNKIVEAAVEYKCDYIFFIDSDTLIQKGQLEKLLSHDKDAITGLSYMRAAPYYSLIRKRVAYRLYNPIEPQGQELIKIDGAGFGCFLIKVSAFDKIEYPWFRFHFFKYEDKWRHIGEDLYLCEQLENANIEIYCDPTVECVHVGTDVTIDMANKYKDFRVIILDEIKASRKELSEFTGLSEEEVTVKCNIAVDLIAKQYKQEIIDTGKDPKIFYKENKNYIFDLVDWHMQKRRSFDIGLAENIKKTYPDVKTILDFGSGCGQNAIDLAKAGYIVAMADYEGYTSQFARFRAKKRGLDIKFYDMEKPINDKFDIILAFDVLEHIPDQEFENVINLLKSLKSDNGKGKVITTVAFGTQNGAHPMHYAESPRKTELIKSLNENSKIDINSLNTVANKDTNINIIDNINVDNLNKINDPIKILQR